MTKYRVLLFCLALIVTLPLLAQDSVMNRTDRNRMHGLENTPSLMGETLSGAVRTVDDHALADARVEVRELLTGRVVASAYSLPNGSWEVFGVPRGQYEVVATVGVQEARERVEVGPGTNVLLRMSDPVSGGGGGSISVAALKIPAKARKAYEKANEAFQKHKFDEARRELAKALAIEPKYAQALTLRGVLDLSENKLEEARQELEQAVSDDSGYGMGYVVLGAAYNMLQRYDDAIRTLERGMALVPSSWQAYFEMAKAQLAKGQYDRALRTIQRAGDLAPADYAPIYLVRAHALLGLKDYRQAITELEQFLGKDPNGANAAEARNTLAQVRAFAAAGQK